MAVYDGFFDAVYNEETGQYDRAYDSGEFTQYFGQIVGTGVCVTTDPDSCRVTLADGQAAVNMGYLFINGYWLRIQDEPYTIDLTGTGPQAVVAYLNTGKKMIELEAQPAAESYPPDTLVLSIVDPAAGTAEDTRYDRELCGAIDSAGGLSDKAAYAQAYIDNEIAGRLQEIEAAVKAQETRLEEKIEEVGAVVEQIAPLPIGTIRFSANQNPGEEWLRCDGRIIGRAEYPELVDMLLKISGFETGEVFSWRSAEMASSAGWRGITYGNGKFVAVADDGLKVAYSTDGITWSETTIPSVTSHTKRIDWSSVAYGVGKFVAVPDGDYIAAYSTDGITWWTTTIADGYISGWSSVAYGGGKFVAVADNYHIGNSNKRYMAYSIDGITWRVISPPSESRWHGVTYGSDKFVAVAYNSDKAIYSRDGVNWTTITLPASANWCSITYGNGKFVAIAEDSDTAAYSADGITWKATTLPVSANWYSVAYGNGKFVAVADDGNTAAYSTDGINWVAANLPFSSGWRSITYGGEKFVAIAYNSNRVAYSAPFENAKLPTLSLSNVPAYIKAKEAAT